MARKKTAPELEAILERIPEDKKYIGRKLIDELVFMQDTLTQLKRKSKRTAQRKNLYRGNRTLYGKAQPLRAITPQYRDTARYINSLPT